MPKQDKLNRITAALNCREGDRVPVGDSFWTGFARRARAQWPDAEDLYRFFDLDYVIVSPNMDPVIQDFEVIEQRGEDIKVKTGFGATILRRADLPMPHFDAFSIQTPEDMANFVLQPPDDPRRLYRAGQDQINCLGDTLAQGVPAWNDRLNGYCNDFPVFGSVCEGYEYLWRCTGTENALMWMLTDEETFEAFVRRIGDFLVGLAEFQIREAKGRLSGMYIWGDIAYVNGMMLSPEAWRRYFKPIVRRIIQVCRGAGLLVVYHGCGNATPVYEDFIEMGLQGYNPLEVKAGLDVVALKQHYGGRLAFVGNIDVRVLESGDAAKIEKEVLYKLKAAQGGGWVCQSDHSVSSQVPPESYAYMVELVRRWGVFPLDIPRIDRRLAELA